MSIFVYKSFSEQYRIFLIQVSNHKQQSKINHFTQTLIRFTQSLKFLLLRIKMKPLTQFLSFHSLHQYFCYFLIKLHQSIIRRQIIAVSQLAQLQSILNIIQMQVAPKIWLPIAGRSLSYSLSYLRSSQSHKQVPTFKSRKDHLRQIQKDPNYDVLVIGGGCNGAGVLLDASTRGLKTLLIEKDDFSSGASSKSTKLVHGGVRYLQQVFEFSFKSLPSRLQKYQLVKQSIQERNSLIDSASHLAKKVPCVIPCTNIFYAGYYYLGSYMYYLIYKWFSPKTSTVFLPPYFFNRRELQQAFPSINPKYSRGIVYEDGSFNDSRVLLSAIFTSTLGNGLKMPESFVPGNAINRAQFVQFIKNAEGKIIGGVFIDLLTKKIYKVNAKYVINCTGVWADKIRLLDDPLAKKRIIAVGGSHIVYDAKLTSSVYGITAPTSDGRIILVQPWLGKILAGTTEKTFAEPTNNPTCSQDQRQFINETIMDLVSKLDAKSFYKHEKSKWCGLRPLVVDNADKLDTKSIARKHVIEQQKSGLLSLMGGKWTIYRRMGEDLVDQIAKKEEKQGKKLPPCQTLGLPLLGSAPESTKQELTKNYGDIGTQLYYNFGWLANQVAKGNLQRVHESTSLAELEWIVKNEMVTSIEDVLLRRTRLCFLLPKAEIQPLVAVIGKLLQKQLNWSDQQTHQQINNSLKTIFSYEFG